MRKLLLLPCFLLFAATAFAITPIGSCTGTTSCTPPAHLTGDIFLAFATRNGSATAPTNPSGWTSVTTVTIAGAGSADSAVRLSCKITTSGSDTATGFTNSSNLIVLVYRGQAAGLTAACTNGGVILGTAQTFSTAPNTTSQTLAYQGVTTGSPSSWVAGFGFAHAATDVEQAPTGMTNRASSGAGPEAAGHDTNAGVSSFASANVTVNVASRLISITIEIKPAACSSTSFGNDYTCVQTAYATNGGGAASVTATFSSGVAGGNAVFMFYFSCSTDSGCSATTTPTVTFSNPAADTFTTAPSSCFSLQSDTRKMCMGATFNVTAGQTAFTCAPNGTYWYIRCFAVEIAMPAGTKSYDVTGGATGTSGTPSASLSGTTAQAIELIMGYLENGNPNAITPGSGFTELLEPETGHMIEAKVVTSTGSYACDGTHTSDTWHAVCMAAKSAAAGGAAARRRMVN